MRAWLEVGNDGTLAEAERVARDAGLVEVSFLGVRHGCWLRVEGSLADGTDLGAFREGCRRALDGRFFAAGELG